MLQSECSVNAKLLYGLLLNRTMLSRRSGWVNEEGNVYVIYTVRQMAEALNRSERTVNTALCELENAGLLVRTRQGFCKANLLYLKLPDDVQKLADPDAQKASGQDAQEIAGPEAQNLPTSHTDTEYKEKRKKKEENTRRCFGEFENVFLSGDELAALQAGYPDRYEAYITRLSRYMAASDRHYANHYAVILKWLDEDSRGKGTGGYHYEESEGDCL